MALGVLWTFCGSPECTLEQEVWVDAGISDDDSSAAGVWVPDTHELRVVSLEEKSRIERSGPDWWTWRTLGVEPKCLGRSEKTELEKGTQARPKDVSLLYETVFSQRKVKGMPTLEGKQKKGFI